jgi:hypothetical protein
MTTQGIAQAVSSSLHDVFLVGAPVALAGFVIVLFLREQPLRTGRGQNQDTTSASKAPREERAAA